MARLPLLILLLCLTVGCTRPEGERLDGAALQALYVDHTATGYHERKDFRFRRHFAPDGTLETWNDREGHRRGRWRISDDGHHCVRMAGADEHCRDVYRGVDGRYRKYGWVWYGYRLLLSYEGFRPGRRLTP